MYSTLPSASALARTARCALSGLAFTTWALCHSGSAPSCSAAASAPRKFGILPTTVPGGFAAPSRSSSAQMRLRTSCLARSISMRACSDWTFSGPHLPGSRHQREQPLVQVLRKRLVAPWAELTDRRERHVQPTPTAGYLQQVDRPVEHRYCMVNVALADVREGQVPKNDRLRLVTTLQPARGALQDRPRLRIVAKSEIAGASHPSEPVRGEEAVGRIAGLVRGGNRLVVVADGSCMVAALRRVPDELAHERRQLCLNDLEFMADPTVRSVPPKERDLARALSGCGKQRGRGGKVVLLGKGLRSLAQISDGRQVHTARVLHDVVEPLGRFHAQEWIGGAAGRDGRSGAWSRERCP